MMHGNMNINKYNIDRYCCIKAKLVTDDDYDDDDDDDEEHDMMHMAINSLAVVIPARVLSGKLQWNVWCVIYCVKLENHDSSRN